MRTPYPELQTDVTALRAAFADWNAAIQRSMDEYALHPLARCGHGPHCARAYSRSKA